MNDRRVRIIEALNAWLERHPEPDEPTLFLAGGGYSARQLLLEMQHGTEFGKGFLDTFEMACGEQDLDPITVIERSGMHS